MHIRAWNVPFTVLSTGCSLQLEVWPLVLLWNILRISTKVPILKNWGLLLSKGKDQPGVGAQVNSVNRKLLFKSRWTPLSCQRSHTCETGNFHLCIIQIRSRFQELIPISAHIIIYSFDWFAKSYQQGEESHQTLAHSHHSPGRGISFSVVSLPTKTMTLAASQLDTESLWKDSRPPAWSHHSFQNPLWVWWCWWIASSRSHLVVRSVVSLVLCGDFDLLHR